MGQEILLDVEHVDIPLLRGAVVCLVYSPALLHPVLRLAVLRCS